MRPTPAQIEETRSALRDKLAKAIPSERVGKLALVHVVDPNAGLDVHMLAAPLTLAGWKALQDAQLDDPTTAQNNLIPARVGYPADALDLARKWPALGAKLAEDLDRRAKPDGAPSWRPLESSAPPSGLSADDAQRLAASSLRPLWTMTNGRLVVVFEAPDPDVYHATRSRYRDARDASKGLVDSFEQAVRGSVKWASFDLETQLDETPWLLSRLFDAWSAAGGAMAECKSELV